MLGRKIKDDNSKNQAGLKTHKIENAGSVSRPLIALSVVLAAGIFILDISLPLGVASGVPYVTLVLISLWSPKREFTIIMAITGTVLTMTGLFMSTAGGEMWMVVTNRSLALFAIWITTILTLLHKRVETALREGNDMLSVAEEVGSTGSWEWDVASNKVIFSENACRIHGVKQEEFNETFDECIGFIHPDDREMVTEKIEKMVATRKPDKFDYRIIKPDGSVRDICGTNRMFFDNNGNLFKLMGVVQDITERKRAEEELRNSELRYRGIVEDQTEFISRFLLDGTLTFVNEALCRYFNTTRDELIGKSFLPFVAEEDREMVINLMNSLTVDNPTSTHDQRTPTPNGEVLWQQWTNRAIFNDNGELTEIQSVGRDITERKGAEEELQHQRDYLDKLHSSIAEPIFSVKMPERVIESVNRSVETVFGYKPEECIGKSTAIFYPDEESRIAFGTKLRESIREGKEVQRTEQLLKRKNGEIFPGEITTSFIKENGEITSVISIAKDITERKRADEELQYRNEILEKIFATAHYSVILLDKEFNIIRVNKAYADTSGFEPEYFKGKNHFDLYPNEETESIFAKVVNTGEPYTVYARPFEFPDMPEKGVTYWDWSLFPVKNELGEIDGLLFTLVEVTEHVRAKQKLELSARVIDSAVEGVMITDSDAVIASVNPAFTEITGYSLEEVVGKKPNFLKSDRHDRKFFDRMWGSLLKTGRWQGEIWNRRKNGEAYPERLTINAIKDKNGMTTQYASVFYDITEIKRGEEEIQYRAYHDALTGLPNRALFLDRLKQTVARAKRDKSRFGVLFIDLDNFKNINDSLGHDIGDLFLQEVSKLLKTCAREGDTVSRLGGDEFTIILDNLDLDQEAGIVAMRVIEVLANPINIRGNELRTTVSIGISIYPVNGTTAKDLLKNADTAMYYVKDLGKNNFHYFTESLNENAVKRMSLETSLHKAIENDEIKAYYQPKIDLKSGQVAGLEALVRWHRKDGTVVSPADFIPIAEETGLITNIDRLMVQKACTFKKSLMDRHFMELADPFTISVNLSARDFERFDLSQDLVATVKRSGLTPRDLELEVTESVIIKNVDKVILTLRKLRDIGFSVSIDDFGTGYSSLNYLTKLPINILKIDKTFVDDLPTDVKAKAVARAIVTMAHDLNIKVVAEGVEKRSQLEFLRSVGCDQIQGYIFSPALPENEIIKLLRDDNRLSTNNGVKDSTIYMQMNSHN